MSPPEDPHYQPDCRICVWLEQYEVSPEQDIRERRRTCGICGEMSGAHGWLHPHRSTGVMDVKCDGFAEFIPQNAL